MAQIQKGQVLIVAEGEGVYLEEGKSVNSLEKSMSSVFSKISDIDTAKRKIFHITITNIKEDQQVTWLEFISDKNDKKANVDYNSTFAFFNELLRKKLRSQFIKLNQLPLYVE